MFLACIIILPFTARNVIISGYVIYPYAWLDIFQVDWKMPAYMVNRDNHEIMAWGRTLNDVSKYAMPFREWFPIWLSNIGRYYTGLVMINIILVCITALREMVLVVRRKLILDKEKMFVLTTAAFCLMTWLLTAPLLRYGLVYLYLLPVIYMSEILVYIRKKWIINVICIIMAYILAGISYLYLMDRDEKTPLFLPDGYMERSVVGIDFQGLTVYVPADRDLTGYHHFPATPYIGLLDVIEMRGTELEAGFRMKEEYRNARMTNYGACEQE